MACRHLTTATSSWSVPALTWPYRGSSASWEPPCPCAGQCPLVFSITVGWSPTQRWPLAIHHVAPAVGHPSLEFHARDSAVRTESCSYFSLLSPFRLSHCLRVAAHYILKAVVPFSCIFRASPLVTSSLLVQLHGFSCLEKSYSSFSIASNVADKLIY